ncbi:hypothetical protein [Micromonospora foliorum]|uniref:hypothetical protein n=1 Tax=Micromonospora foliorum TaxID=2911210 RepID=UPI001EE96275|nr:hypothetical protein [Micromonospora foliorum]MCG5440666.1 hypothetical protein [Micromonospora foliorum]
MTGLNSGDVVLIGSACSVQFSGERALRLRLVSIGSVDPYDGWVWLTGYVLDAKGAATDKREVYVQRAGIVVEQEHPGSPPPGRNVAQARTSPPRLRKSPQSALP